MCSFSAAKIWRSVLSIELEQQDSLNKENPRYDNIYFGHVGVHFEFFLFFPGKKIGVQKKYKMTKGSVPVTQNIHQDLPATFSLLTNFRMSKKHQGSCAMLFSSLLAHPLEFSRVILTLS